MVALDADVHALIEQFRIVGREEIGRAFVGGPRRFPFGRARGHYKSDGDQKSGASHRTSTERLKAAQIMEMNSGLGT
jgi:hypothetical protein